MTLSIIILSRNNANQIADCVQSALWADTVLVFDSGSADETVAIASAAGAQTAFHPWQNYTVQRNAALLAVATDWVFFLDSDERCTPALRAEIESVLNQTDPAGYWIPRHNYIFGKLTRYAGWYPDYQLRLMQRARAHYDTSREVHELVVLQGQAGHLTQPIVHYNYRDLSQFVAKQRAYALLAAQEAAAQGQRTKWRNYILQPARQFIWRFWQLRGYRDGLHGLRLSALMAAAEFGKYRQLARLGRGKT
jgi:(heptosyl)LPS beta-1,4-glucosyltransferase